METVLNTPKVSFEDFYEVPNLKFDIEKLRADLDKILEEKKFNSPGVTHFGAIPLNQIPNDENSIKGNNIRGKYWTKPDSSFEEMEREPYIDETRYTLFNPKLNNTYFKYVYEKINEFFEIGRCRVIKMPPRTTLSWHRDPERRLHIAIKTNYGARMFIEHTGHHIPADGNIYLTDNTKYHTAINGGEEDRIHLVATVLGTK